ncbi:MaoC family dehydratase [Rhizobium sp. BR 314]|uniref:MaoC family dehydratase n=1 Tax=Rhizobium sp. BR 314 TaxID=3040013 RepID=UPI0039BEF7BA
MSDHTTMPELYLEDLEIGQRFTSPSHVMELDEIKEFAGRYDPQFFHLDEELARDSLFGRLAASGWHTAATTMRLLVQSLPLAGGLIGAGAEISWPRATWPGDRIHVESEITAITLSRSQPKRGFVTVRSETINQSGEIVQVFTPKIVGWRRA